MQPKNNKIIIIILSILIVIMLSIIVVSLVFINKGNSEENNVGESESLIRKQSEELSKKEEEEAIAQGKKLVKYAVQIYGIQQDEDNDGNKLGLTFGPATGTNYNEGYVTHTYKQNSNGTYDVIRVYHRVSENGNETVTENVLKNSKQETVTRTEKEKNKYDRNIHDMSWEEIKNQSQEDPTVFLDCMLCGDTKSVKMYLNEKIADEKEDYTCYGDGTGCIVRTIKNNYKMWNPGKAQNKEVKANSFFGSNAKDSGGYASSHIRATLIGENNKTNKDCAGDENLSKDECLFSCIESNLQKVITGKRIKYLTVTSDGKENLNNDLSDKIWLFSERELFGTGERNGESKEGLGINGNGYDKFGNKDSYYYMPSYSLKGSNNRKAIKEDGIIATYWLRSIDKNRDYAVAYVCAAAGIITDPGEISSCAVNNYTGIGISFGFCIK